MSGREYWTKLWARQSPTKGVDMNPWANTWIFCLGFWRLGIKYKITLQASASTLNDQFYDTESCSCVHGSEMTNVVCVW